MKCFTIKIDAQFISGLSNDVHDIEDISNKGFHYSNKCGINKITFSDNKEDAMRIVGVRNLHSWVDKLHTRMDLGLIVFNTMTIQTEQI